MSPMDEGRRRGLKALSGAAAWGALGAGGLSLGSLGLGGCSRHAPTALPTQVEGGWLGPVLARGHAWRDGQFKPADAGSAHAVHTLVIGAGVAGLSAAHHLMKLGIDDLAVIDLDDQPGGNAQAHHMGGLPCPTGAHYLPMPGPQAHEVQAWLAELGVIRQVHGRWVADERFACHDPQERMFVPGGSGASLASRDPGPTNTPTSAPTSTPAPGGLWRQGHWQDGFWPPASPTASAEWLRLAQAISRTRQTLGFSMPTHRAPWTPAHAALDGQTFAQWLDAQGLSDPGLRWFMDYVCRDDYGAGAERVSAWAGVQYFASRHGLRLPPALGGVARSNAESDAEADPVLTWPEGNGWLTRLLAAPLGDRWHAGHMAVAVQDGRDGVTVHSVDTRDGRPVRWQAQQVVMAVPLRLAHQLLDAPPSALQAVQARIDTAPWLVSNLLLSASLDPRPGEALSWDNVFYSAEGVAGLPPSLGYVDARHQNLAAPTGPSLLTHYWALGGQTAAQGQVWRRSLRERSWQAWAWSVCQDLMRVHPDLPDKLLRIDLRRHGHAMVIPQPGLRSHAGLQALMRPQGASGRLHFAHADLSAYSVFEEAFTHGARAARQVHGA
jgi:predicted NAD/FAD-dependent oxidoreductase